jgi:hypothetical protein
MALTTTQVESMSTSQIAALGVDIASLRTLGTPIVLDLNGDGVSTLNYASGVKFDLFAQGQAVQTGWVSSSDGLLVLDRNQDGQINDGSELFGSATKLASGATASDGYQALRELDSNADGVINQDDAVYKELGVWVDSNSDGISETGEVKTLASLGITSISVQATAGTDTNNGNVVGLTSTYDTADGTTHAAADVWFVADKVTSSATVVQPANADVDQAIAALATTGATASTTDSASAVSDAGVVAAVSNLNPVGAPVASNDLRSRVSSLAQAIGAFDGTNPSDTAGLKSSASSEVLASNTPAALAVVSMADAMKKFDASGNLAGNPEVTAAPAVSPIKLASLYDSPNGGVLVAGK